MHEYLTGLEAELKSLKPKKGIEDLNKIVIEYCVPKVYGEVIGYMQYKFDASTLVVPLTRPVNTYNSKELVLNNFF